MISTMHVAGSFLYARNWKMKSHSWLSKRRCKLPSRSERPGSLECWNRASPGRP